MYIINILYRHESMARAKYFSDLMNYKTKMREQESNDFSLFESVETKKKLKEIKKPQYQKFRIWRYIHQNDINKMVVQCVDMEKVRRLKETQLKKQKTLYGSKINTLKN